MKKTVLALFLLLTAISTTGCSSIQERIAQPVATISGKVVVPSGQVPTGVKITVAGDSSNAAYVNSYGYYNLELKESGKFLLMARGEGFDPAFVWVDAKVEETVKPENISMSQKITNEAVFMTSLIDFPDAKSFAIKAISPTWTQGTVEMNDDGVNGDVLANDGIFTLRMTNITSGYQQYSIVWTDSDGKSNTVSDPHAESTYNKNSTVYIPEAAVKQVKGSVTSDLTGVNYSEVKLATKKGSRTTTLNSDGSYVFAMEGSGREYLVFRSETYHIKVVPVDLSSINVLEVPTTTLASKKSGELRVMLVASDFATCENPTVVGDFTNWQPQQLYDDGTYGDETAGDGVYTRTFTGIAAGYHKYAFNITDSNQVKDPYQESGDSAYSIIQVK
jgi:hypothetical protein